MNSSPLVQISGHSHYTVPSRVSSQAQPTATPGWPHPSQQAHTWDHGGVWWCCWIHWDLPGSILPPELNPRSSPLLSAATSDQRGLSNGKTTADNQKAEAGSGKQEAETAPSCDTRT